jgi:Xaa-Pro aminopeptidase
MHRQEYQSRRDRLQAAMARAGLDALVIGGRGVIAQNGFLIYLTGYCPVIRPAYAVLAAGGDPVLLVTTPSDQWLARRGGFDGEIRVLEPAADGTDPMGSAAALRELLHAREKVGVVGLEEIIPAAEFLRWQAALPGVAFTPATPVMAQVKAVKSARDLDGMRAVAGSVDDAFTALLAALRGGGSPAAAAGAAEASLRAAGAVEILVYVSALPHFLHRPDTAPPAAGSLITAFVEASDGDGYWVELARLIAIGALDARQRHLAGQSLLAMQCAQASLRPGDSGGAAYAAIARQIGAAGLSSGLWYGHGVGVDHDLPVIGHGNDTLLQPGMVIALHPHIVDAGADGAGGIGACLGDTFVISASGAAPLSRHGRDVVAIASPA